MKYTATISGKGGELVIGKVSKEVFEYFQTESLGKYMDYVEDAPEHIAKQLPRDISETSDILHVFAPFFDTTTYMSVKDENDEEIFIGTMGEDSEDLDYEFAGIYNKRLSLLEMRGDNLYLFLGLDIQQGLFNDYVFETEKFDPEKFSIEFDHITDGICYDVYFVKGVRYDEKLIEPSGDHSTIGKSANYRLYDIDNIAFVTEEANDY